MTDNERSLAAKMAANLSWARTEDRGARTLPARLALMAKFERDIDPEGKLPPAVRAQRAENARKAYYQALALKSLKARRNRKK